ncbi:MAG: type III-B CRISPR module RAMP protein Cmr4 [Thermotogae bacterium]|nr:type III-B CRISPR module RAMP protein Cmr4 [Thermotogota bacterium]
MTTDPLHVGTGGYRLGRVDNTVVREPGSRIPKIPGTALHGAIRHYAAMRFGKPKCAGQSGHCGRPTCPICYTFGSITDRGARSGVVHIYDARILLFPVYSMYGPIWVSTPERLREVGLLEGGPSVENGKALWDPDKLPGDSQGSLFINLGWLVLGHGGNLPDINFPQQIPEEIRSRLVLIPEALFTHVVNSNLEVRMSVAINPETGASEDKALFTYEAIPRATVLWMDVVVEDFAGKFPGKSRLQEWESLLKNSKGNEKELKELLKRWNLIGKKEGVSDEAIGKAIEKAKKWIDEAQERITKFEDQAPQTPIDVVDLGLEWAEYLGIGGMGTRGFGRMRVLCVETPSDHETHTEGYQQEGQDEPSQP